MAKKRPPNYFATSDAARLADIGRLVAEEDIHLRDYYVGRERYVDRALSFGDPAVFFIGPKGAGKSAILQMVRLERNADI